MAGHGHKKAWLFGGFALAIFAVALLIAAVVLLAVILHNQNKDDNNSNNNEVLTTTVTRTSQPTTAPQEISKLLVLIDASASVASDLFYKQVSFAVNQLRNHLISDPPEYDDYDRIQIAIVPYDSHLRTTVTFVEVLDDASVKALAESANASLSDQRSPLNIGSALAELSRPAVFKSFVALIASSQGENYDGAVQEALTLKAEAGLVITAISLDDNGTSIQDLSYGDGFSLDGRAITDDDQQGLEELARKTTEVVEKISPETFPISTTTKTNRPSTAISSQSTKYASTSNPKTTVTTAPPTGSPPTTTKPLSAYRIAILADASATVTQSLMKQQGDFLWNNLLPMFKQLSGATDTRTLVLPFAFDTSADFDSYIPIRDESQEVEKYNQVLAVKIAKITTFMTPLDVLQIGQVFKRLSETTEAASMPTHIITFASGQGSDFELAVQKAKEMMDKSISFTTVSILDDDTHFQDISSSGCYISGKGIQTGQDLSGLSEQISKCVYPTSMIPTKKPKKVQQSTSTAAATEKHEEVKTKSPKEALPGESTPTPVPTNDIVVLVDASAASVQGVNAKLQSTFINATLLPQISKSGTRVAIAPYAYYISADVQDFFSLSDTESAQLDAQFQSARIASVVTFAPPLDLLQLAPTLQLLNESSLMTNKALSVLLMANDVGEQFETAKQIANQMITNGANILVVALNTTIEAFKDFTDPNNIFDGSPIGNQDTSQEEALAESIANLLNKKAQLSVDIRPDDSSQRLHSM